MVDPRKVNRVFSNLRNYLEKLTLLASVPRDEFLDDFTKIESAKHLLQNSVEACLDVANHIIAREQFRSPESYAHSFEILVEQGILPEEFLPTLKQMAGFRNRLVHMYWEIDAELLYDNILQTRLGDFNTFVQHVLAYIGNDEGRPQK